MTLDDPRIEAEAWQHKAGAGAKHDQDDAQHWYVSMERVGSTALFSFHLKKYDLWMHVDGASHNNGAVMLLWPGTGKERHARWIALQRGAWLNLQSAESGLLIAVPEGRKTSGTPIIQWAPTMEDDQGLRILPLRKISK